MKKITRNINRFDTWTNSSLRKTFDNAVKICKQCELEGNNAICDRKDCFNHYKPLNKKEMRERFDDLFYEEINSFMGTVFGDKMLDYAIKDFIELEINLALKEQQDDIIKKIEDKLYPIIKKNEPIDCWTAYDKIKDNIISLIKNINIE